MYMEMCLVWNPVWSPYRYQEMHDSGDMCTRCTPVLGTYRNCEIYAGVEIICVSIMP